MNNFNSHRTLILNSTFQPLSVASAKRSVSLLLSKKINVIKKSNLEIRSENKSEVIRNLDKAYSDGIITKNFRDRNKSRISKLQ